jgi:hypothetical protein
MATSQSEVTARHAAQIGVAAVMAHELRAAVRTVDVQHLRQSIPTLSELVAALTTRYGAASATLAVRHYNESRAAAGVTGRFTPHPADPPPRAQVDAMVSWATQPLWTPQKPAEKPPESRVAPSAPSSPTPTAPTPERALQVAEKNLVAGAERLVLNQARETTVENVQRDRKARAWAREVRPGCCAFCALNASRGAVYKTRDSAGADINSKFTGSGQFKFHNDCHCDVVPVFGAFEMSATAREAKAVYENRGDGDALNAFRRSWEDRNRPEGFKPRKPR